MGGDTEPKACRSHLGFPTLHSCRCRRASKCAALSKMPPLSPSRARALPCMLAAVKNVCKCLRSEESGVQMTLSLPPDNHREVGGRATDSGHNQCPLGVPGSGLLSRLSVSGLSFFFSFSQMVILQSVIYSSNLRDREKHREK